MFYDPNGKWINNFMRQPSILILAPVLCNHLAINNYCNCIPSSSNNNNHHVNLCRSKRSKIYEIYDCKRFEIFTCLYVSISIGWQKGEVRYWVETLDTVDTVLFSKNCSSQFNNYLQRIETYSLTDSLRAMGVMIISLNFGWNFYHLCRCHFEAFCHKTGLRIFSVYVSMNSD